MSIRPYRDIVRRKSRRIMVGSVPVGGDSPITVQTMTNTLTADAQATIDQIRRCEEAGVDIIRVSCPDEESTAALPAIVKAATASTLDSFGRSVCPPGRKSAIAASARGYSPEYMVPTLFAACGYASARIAASG